MLGKERTIQVLLLISAVGLSLGNINGFHRVSHIHTEEEWRARLQNNSNADETLYIHLLPHTHDDVGWLKTVDMYYTGSNQPVQWAEVHLILDSTIEQLLKDPTRRFTYVEMKFFSMWWKYQSDATKSDVRLLVEEGRLEFVNAGWSMHDEACTHYEDMLDNMMYGQQWLQRELGVAPTIGWHVDPFGHSSANARLFADMGLDAWFFARLDYQDKEKRMEEQSLQFIWQPFYSHLGDSSQIFTGVMQDHYCWPDGFWYDERFMGDDPVVTNEKLTTFNADVKAREMYEYAKYQMAPHYRGNHIMIPMGCDFSYANANINFKNMDRLMGYFNEKYEDAVLIYSTPSDYLNAIKEQDLTFPVMYEDMFPYADQPEDYWTGYFTSRANSKGQVRVGQANLISSGKLYSEKVLEETVEDGLLDGYTKVMDAMGVYQHHDGVSGTAKQYVADDYTYKLYEAMEMNNEEFAKVIGEHLERETGIQATEWEWCQSDNLTFNQCPIKNNQKSSFMLAAYNPSLLARDYLKIKVPHGNYKVQRIDPTSQTFTDVPAEVICLTLATSEGLIQDCDMHMQVSIEGDSLAYLAVAYDKNSNLKISGSYQDKVIQNAYESLEFVEFGLENGATFKVTKKDSVGTEFTLGFDVRFYYANQGGDDYDDSDNCPSGAYIFKPSKNYQFSQRYASMIVQNTFLGSIVQEFHFIFEDRSVTEQAAMVKLRVYKDLPVSQWEVTLNGIPEVHRNGMEVTVNWKALEIDNADTFYTDSNALEMQKRVLNYRPQWEFSSNQKVSSNYYPVNSAIAIRDETAGYQMTVMNDRSQGGSVLETGRIELMQNRRLYYDDYRGVGEALNEKDDDDEPIKVHATYHVHLFNLASESSFQRAGQLLIDEPLQVFYSFESALPTSISGTASPRANPLTALVGQSPAAVPLKYALFPVSRNKVQLRLTHLGDKFDMDEQTVYVKIKELGQYLWGLSNDESTLNSINVVELTLSGNQELSVAEAKKTQWVLDATVVPPEAPAIPADKADFEVAMQQMRIRMFELTFEPLAAAIGIANQ